MDEHATAQNLVLDNNNNNNKNNNKKLTPNTMCKNNKNNNKKLTPNTMCSRDSSKLRQLSLSSFFLTLLAWLVMPSPDFPLFFFFFFTA